MKRGNKLRSKNTASMRHLAVPLGMSTLLAVGSHGSALAQEAERVRTAAQPLSTAQAGEQTLEEIVVTSTVFIQNDAFGATKMGLAIKDTPQTVAVVTGDLIDVSGMQTFNDFYKVDASGGPSQAIDAFPRNYYRGFRQQGNNAIRVDGFRMPGNINLDFATFDRFEVIKGPTSTLYGQSSIGGTLNAVSKIPQDRFAAEFGVEGGEFNHYRVDGDITGPVGDSDAWSYRLIGAYADEDSFIDYVNDNLNLLSASIAYEPGDATRLTLRGTWQQQELRMHFAPILQLAGNGTGDIVDRIVNEGLKVPDVTRSRFFGMPWNHADIDAGFIEFQGEHTFSNDWQLRAHAQYNRVKYVSDAFGVNGPFDQDGFAYFSYVYGQDNVQDLYGGEVDLFGKVELFGREHTLFFAVDYNRIGFEERGGVTYLSSGFEDSTFNIFDPDYSAVPRAGLDTYAYLYDSDNETELFGATVELIVNPMDRVNILLGARYSGDTLVTRERGGTRDPGDSIDDKSFDEQRLDFDNVTFQGGVTYALTDAVNLYASYGQTFEPQTLRTFVADGQPGKLIDPEEGTNYEIGAKADLSNDFSFTMAIFQMERTNIAQRDEDHPQFSLPIGTQRSRGVELGGQGRLSPEFSFYGSIAYLDAEFTEGEFEGLQPPNAPRFGVSAFGTYEILHGGLKGLGFGLGVVHKSGLETFDDDKTRAAGQPVTFDFGDFTEVDGRVFYNRDRWTFTLSATNLFDEKYYSPTFTDLDYAVHVNRPMTVRASARFKF